MKKYVVGYEDEPIVICGTIPDAEEMIFSLAEENAYEEYVAEVCLYGMTSKDWFSNLRVKAEDCADYRKQYGYRLYETFEGYILSCFSDEYYIREVEEI